MFPSRVFDAGDRGHVLIGGHSNAKLGKKVVKGPWAGMPIYTLSLEERATCPRSCAVWAECYGNALALSVRWRYSPELIKQIGIELRGLAAKYPRGYVVRLHVLGDFPDVGYVAQWRTWLENTRQLHVWGYTANPPESPIGMAVASINTDHQSRWAIRFSVDGGHEHAAMQAAVHWGKASDIKPSVGIVCPAETGETQTCGTCGLCWSPAAADRRIVFLGHGKRTRGPAKSKSTGSDGMAERGDIVWTEHLINYLRELWVLPISTSEMARRMSGPAGQTVTKSALVGKAHRLELDAKPSPIRTRDGSPYQLQPRRNKLLEPQTPLGPRRPMASGMALMAPLTSVEEKLKAPPLPPLPPAQPINVFVTPRQPIPPPAPRPPPEPPKLFRRSADCCWPIGEPGTKAFRFCEGIAEGGKPYCLEHSNIAFVKIRDRKVDVAGA